jgi:hypothetical protein
MTDYPPQPQFTTMQQMFDGMQKILNELEDERIIILCHPTKHSALLPKLNEFLDTHPGVRAALMASDIVSEDKLYTTRRKYMDNR